MSAPLVYLRRPGESMRVAAIMAAATAQRNGFSASTIEDVGHEFEIGIDPPELDRFQTTELLAELERELVHAGAEVFPTKRDAAERSRAFAPRCRGKA